MKVKYLILDFGKVLAYPTTGYWFLTPKFMELVDMNKIDKEKLQKAMGNASPILSRKAITLEDEYQLFYDYFTSLFKDAEIDFLDNKEDIIKEITYNITYEDDKYGFYENIHSELEELSKKYKLLLLSDNWPCADRIMKNANVYKYFDKIYISSVYGEEKKNGRFFEFPINDYNIQKGEAIFIDDNESLLDVAVTKGLDVRLMDRDKTNVFSKYEVINDLEKL